VVPDAKLGEKCDPSGAEAPDCQPLIGIFCARQAKTCKQETIAKLGESCVAKGTDDRIHCDRGLDCNDADGKCATQPPLGAACGAKNLNYPCAAPGRCNAGVCALPQTCH
jgi:hypothetical protein